MSGWHVPIMINVWTNTMVSLGYMIMKNCPPFRSTWVCPRFLVEFRVTRSLVLCVCFVDCCLSFCTFSFVFLRITDSDYPFGIFKLFLYNNEETDIFTKMWHKFNKVNRPWKWSRGRVKRLGWHVPSMINVWTKYVNGEID